MAKQGAESAMLERPLTVTPAPAAAPDWARLRGLLDPVPVGVILFDCQGGPLLANRAARDFLGEAASEPLSAWVASGRFLLPSGESAHEEDLPPCQTLVDGTAHVERELTFSRFAERSLPLLVSSRSVLDPDGRVTQVACTMTPIQELCRRREEDRQKQRMDAIGTLAASVAGPLNDALTAIAGYCELAGARLGGEKPLGRLVAAIQEAGERASLLVHRFFSHARREVATPRAVALDQWLYAQTSTFHTLLGDLVELEVVPGAPGANVRADPRLLQQVLADILANARDAMPDGGRVRIETSATGQGGAVLPGQEVPGTAAVTVTDAGGGIEEGVLRRIFEPFFTTKPGALGLGLSTAERLVRAQGGHLRVENHRGVGATFHVHLPLASQPEAVQQAAETAVRSDRPATVLLVEDDPVVRDLVKEILESEGLTVLEARHAEHARQLIASSTRRPLDLLVTDVVMPGLSGATFAQDLRAEYPHLKVLVMSGCNDPRLVASITADGTAFLPKPFPPAALRHQVRELLQDHDSP